MMNFWNQMNFDGPFQSRREMNEPRHSFPPWFWSRGSLCPGLFLNDLRNVFRHRRSDTHHGSDVVAGCPASIMPQIYYLRSVVSSFPVKAEIDWSPPHTTLFPSALHQSVTGVSRPGSASLLTCCLQTLHLTICAAIAHLGLLRSCARSNPFGTAERSELFSLPPHRLLAARLTT